MTFGILWYFIIEYKREGEPFNIFETEYFGYDEIFGEVSKHKSIAIWFCDALEYYITIHISQVSSIVRSATRVSELQPS